MPVSPPLHCFKNAALYSFYILLLRNVIVSYSTVYRQIRKMGMEEAVGGSTFVVTVFYSAVYTPQEMSPKCRSI